MEDNKKKGLGMVLEGGGMRGLYTAGVLDELMEQIFLFLRGAEADGSAVGTGTATPEFRKEIIDFVNSGVASSPNNGEIVCLIGPIPLYKINSDTKAPIIPSICHFVSNSTTIAISTQVVVNTSFLLSALVASNVVEWICLPFFL